MYYKCIINIIVRIIDVCKMWEIFFMEEMKEMVIYLIIYILFFLYKDYFRIYNYVYM